MRVHKNLMKNILDKNFPVMLSHIENKIEKNVFLSEVNANIDDLSLTIRPTDSGWDNLQTDLFFDQGQIVMEINGLEYNGTGRITDPSTGTQENIKLSCKIDLAQLVLSMDQELTDEGYIYPKIDVSEVVFTLNQDLFQINLEGDLPLYKNHRFEEGIKKWMNS